MNKKFATMMAVALAGAMCIGFAACGEAKTPSPEKGEGSEVTAAQWTSAMEYFQKDDAQYTVDASLTVSYEFSSFPDPEHEGRTVSGKFSVIQEQRGVKDGAKEYLKSNSKTEGDKALEAVASAIGMPGGEFGETEEQYYEKTAQGISVYRKEDGKWTKTASGSLDFSRGLMSAVTEWEFDSCVYSEEEKGYILKEAIEGISLNYKFNADGKLVAFVLISEGEEEGIKMSYTYSFGISYAATELTLPTVSE